MIIRYIKREEIDLLKWNSCIHYASNGNIYGYSWYLDNTCEHWDGLVEGDYESVFPLTFNRKLFGFEQLYQPVFCQQLGIFSVHLLSKARIAAFLEAIPPRFRYINIQLNDQNRFKEFGSFEIRPRVNYQLNLNKEYEEIRSAYSSNLRRSLNKAEKLGIHITNSLKPETLVSMYEQYQGHKISGFNVKSVHAAHRIIYNALHKGRGFLFGALDSSEQLCAAGFFLISHQKIINLLPSSTPEGRENCAMHLLLDTVVRSHVSKPMVLDFEGSSIPGIARFYSSFGAKDKPYYQIIRNRLPFWMKWIK